MSKSKKKQLEYYQFRECGNRRYHFTYEVSNIKVGKPGKISNFEWNGHKDMDVFNIRVHISFVGVIIQPIERKCKGFSCNIKIPQGKKPSDFAWFAFTIDLESRETYFNKSGNFGGIRFSFVCFFHIDKYLRYHRSGYQLLDEKNKEKPKISPDKQYNGKSRSPVNHEVRKQKIDAPLDKHKASIAGYITIVVRKDVFKCAFNDHTIIDMLEYIDMIDKKTGKVFQISVPLGYCKECDLYFILESIYNYVNNRGIPQCRIIGIGKNISNLYSRSLNMNLRKQSVLKEHGYSVAEQDNLSDSARKAILTWLLENCILTKSEIISYLDFFISMHSNNYTKRYTDAIIKWESDREFVRNFWSKSYAQFQYERYGKAIKAQVNRNMVTF